MSLPAARRKLSILVPVYNEEPVLDSFFARMLPVLDQIEAAHGLATELVFTDNCSTDDTFGKLKPYAEKDGRIIVYRFSRNVGFQRSILTGYARVTGDACVQIDADLEDPPEMILQFVEKWLEGYKVVYGVRMRRHEGFLRRRGRDLFYALIEALSDVPVPRHAGDFRLIDRRIIDILAQVNDAQPYLRGIIASLGFRQTGIPYNRDARVAGESAFNLRSYMSMAVDGILQSSVRPLYFSAYIGLAGLGVSFLLLMWYLVSFLVFGAQQAGFTTLILVQLSTFSLLALALAVQSVYTGRIYKQVVSRPFSTVETKIRPGGEIEPDPVEAVYWPGRPPERSDA